ncbi:hypothetical protein N7504_002249 [Penicillium tannophilum]|nr:hypothetical protein N7504_002249 [Penicillium tannophilum]
MSLCQLPNELLYMIVGFLNSESSINALARTKRAFFVQFNPFLYWYHVLRPPHHLRTGMHIPALRWAVEHDDPGLLGRLLDAGAYLDVFNEKLWRKSGPFAHHPLRIAARKGHARVLEALLESEDTGHRLRESDYALLVAEAVSNEKILVVRMLLSRSVNPWCDGANANNLLSKAARGKDPDLFELLLLDFTQRSTTPPIAEWKDAYSALDYANAKNCEDYIRLLLTAGIDVNGIDAIRIKREFYKKAVWRPLCRSRRPGPARLLLDAGADPNIDQDDKWGPLACVVGNYVYTTELSVSSQEERDRRMEMLHLLFEYGADPKRAGGGSALHGALRDLDLTSATFLADKGARIRVLELPASDQALLNQAVVEHEWGTVMRLTPPHWSMLEYIGPGLIRKGRYVRRYMLSAGASGGFPPFSPGMTSENCVINESEILPPPMYISPGDVPFPPGLLPLDTSSVEELDQHRRLIENLF